MRTRISPYLFPGLAIAIGLLVLAWGLHTPRYTVPNGRDLLFDPSLRQKTLSGQNAVQQWFDLRDKISTRRWLYCNMGCDFLAIGLSIVVIFLMKRIRNADDFRGMMTPRSKIHLFVYATLAWLSFIPTGWFSIDFCNNTKFPSWVADEIDATSGSDVLLPVIIALPIVLLCVWLVTWRKSEHIAMWSRPTDETLRLRHRGRPLSLEITPEKSSRVMKSEIVEVILPDGRAEKIPLYDRPGVAMMGIMHGPAIIADADATALVPAGWSARITAIGGVVFERF